MTLGEKIRALRTEKLMTQAELAGGFITRNMLSLIEQGKALPSVATLEYVAKRLGVSPGYLLADEDAEGAFRKAGNIRELRAAFRSGNFAIAVDLAEKMLDGAGEDDEIRLLQAESYYRIGKESLFAGRIREAARILDAAAATAEKTVYETRPLRAKIWLLFEFLGSISPTVDSENLDTMYFEKNAWRYLPGDDLFCLYVLGVTEAENGEPERAAFYADALRPDEPMLAWHIDAKLHMRLGEYELAGKHLEEILKDDASLPTAVLYHVFGDLSTAFGKLGNKRLEREFNEAKIGQFEKLFREA